MAVGLCMSTVGQVTRRGWWHVEGVDLLGIRRAGHVKGDSNLEADFWLTLNGPAVSEAFRDVRTVVFSHLGEICC